MGRFYNIDEIPKELLDEIRSDISDESWDTFINNENCFIKKNIVVELLSIPITTKDMGWSIFWTID